MAPGGVHQDHEALSVPGQMSCDHAHGSRIAERGHRDRAGYLRQCRRGSRDRHLSGWAARVSIEIRVLGHAWLAQACVVQDLPRERAQALPPGRSGVNEADAPDPSGCLHALHGQVVLPVGGLGVDDRHAMAVGHPLAERCGG
jgi:hypothetical protein